jgi:thioredoxin 1
MNKKKWGFFPNLSCILLILSILLFSHRASFSQSIADRFPKGIAEISLPKLLDFGAGKCIPCKKMAPILQELAEEYKGRVIIRIIEIYDERELTRVNRIRLIPTQIFFDSNNREIYRHEGFMDREQIKKVFEKMGVNPVRKSSTF